MIHSNMLKRTNDTHLFFLPEPLIAELCYRLRDANIPYKAMSWEDLVTEPYNPKSVLPQYKQSVEHACQKYKTAGYKDINCIGAIESKISNDSLYAMTLLFFGETIDPDYKKQQDELAAIAKRHYYEAYADMPGIPVSKK